MVSNLSADEDVKSTAVRFLTGKIVDGMKNTSHLPRKCTKLLAYLTKALNLSLSLSTSVNVANFFNLRRLLRILEGKTRSSNTDGEDQHVKRFADLPKIMMILLQLSELCQKISLPWKAAASRRLI